MATTLEGSEPLAGALVADRSAPLTVQLEAYAGHLFERFDRFGAAGRAESSPLLDALTARWTLPDRLEGGVELFDIDGLAELARDWSSRVGYFDAQFGLDAPYVVPVDPAEPAPLDARTVQRTARSRPASAMRAVAPRSARPNRPATAPGIRESRPLVAPTATPGVRGPRATSPVEAVGASVEAQIDAPFDALSDAGDYDVGGSLAAPLSSSPIDGPRAAGRTPPAARPLVPRPAMARERWRAVDGQRISAYPAAMGRAGAIDAGLIRFPEARARIGGAAPAIVAGPPALDLMPDGAGLAPASRSAERLVQALVDRLVPAAAAPVSTWLIPIDAPIGRAADIGGLVARTVGEAALGARVGEAAPGAASELAATAPDAVFVAPVGDAAPGTTPAEATAERRAPRQAVDPAARVAAPEARPTPVAGERAAPPAAATPRAVHAATASAARSRTATNRAATDRALALPAAARMAEAMARAIGVGRLAPPAVTGAGRPRVDGRLALPGARPAGDLPPGLAARIDAAERMGITLADPADPRVSSAADALAGALVAPVADGGPPETRTPAPDAAGRTPARAVSAPTGATAARQTAQPSAARGLVQPAVRADAPRITPVDARLGGGALAPSPAIPRPTIGAPAGLTARPTPQIGSRAWLLAALDAGSAPPTTDAPAGALPGATGAAARALAERLAVAMGDVPLLAPEERSIGLGAPRVAEIGAPFSQTLVAPVADALAGGGPLDAAPGARAAATAREAARPATAPTRPSEGTAPAARAGGAPVVDPPRPAAAEVPTVPAVLTAPPTPASAGERGRAAAQWAARIGTRLQTTADGPPIAGIVERIERRLSEGAPGLVEALRRFEAADEPGIGARAWQTVVSEAGLDAAIAELVAPVADTPPGAPPAEASSARRATASPRPTTPAPAARAAAPSVMPPAGRVAAAATGAMAGLAPEVFERRMGRLPAARGATPAGRAWVLDPTGRRWLIPVAAFGAPAGRAPAARPAAQPIGAVDRPSTPAIAAAPAEDRGVARGTTAIRAFVERIVAGADPRAPTPAAIAGVLARMAPAAQQAWIESGFDVGRLPPSERAAIGAVVEPVAPSAAPSPAAAARAPSRRASRAAPASPDVARAMARALSRPGALGSAVAGLAERIEARPSTIRRPTTSAATPAAGTLATPAGGPTPGPVGAPGALPGLAPGAAPASARRSPTPSSMDPVALVAGGATAAEARVSPRLARLWAAAAGVDPASLPAAESAATLGAESSPAYVAPGAVIEPAGATSAPDSGPSGSSVIPMPGARTVDSALRAFDRARSGHRSRASALGRPPAPSDVGQLLTALGSAEPRGQLFGDRGPVTVTPPGAAGRVFIETGKQAAGAEPLRSGGETAGRRTETNEQARHRNADQIEGDMSPEELERLAEQVIEQLRREMMFDSARFGSDEWD